MLIYSELYKWWAKYLHSRGHLKAAINYYEKANDILALTKIYCDLNDVVKVRICDLVSFSAFPFVIQHIHLCIHTKLSHRAF